MLENAEAEFCEYCNRSDIPDSAQRLIAEIAVVRYNRIGAEGLQSQSAGGVSESYEAGYPEQIRQGLNRYRRVRFL
jgi:hypothetical protein